MLIEEHKNLSVIYNVCLCSVFSWVNGVDLNQFSALKSPKHFTWQLTQYEFVELIGQNTLFNVDSGGSDSKESACSAGDLGSIPRLGGFPGWGNGYPLQSSCLQNPMDRGVWWAPVHGVAESQTQVID